VTFRADLNALPVPALDGFAVETAAVELPRIAFWGAAQAFGFRLCEGGDFHPLAFGDLARGAWVGAWRGIDVLARGDWRVAAKLDPALLLGLRPGPRGRLRGYDDRAAIVARHVRDVLRDLTVKRGVAVHDRCVVQHLPPADGTEPPDVALMLNTVTAIAQRLAAIAPTLPRTPREMARDATWARVAARHALAHDLVRGRIVGPYAGSPIAIELVSGEEDLRTRAVVDAGRGASIERWYERPLETVDDLEQALDDCARAATR
jgi:hypothetical protein